MRPECRQLQQERPAHALPSSDCVQGKQRRGARQLEEWRALGQSRSERSRGDTNQSSGRRYLRTCKPSDVSLANEYRHAAEKTSPAAGDLSSELTGEPRLARHECSMTHSVTGA